MIHFSLSYNKNAHWCCSFNEKYILLQLQNEEGEQVRVCLTEGEALSISRFIEETIQQKCLYNARIESATV